MRDRDIEILARTIYGEARGESLEGKRAVACVVLNRFKKNAWFTGKTIADTCMFRAKGSKYYQFSCWNPEDLTHHKMVNASIEELGECLTVAIEAVDGKLIDITHGSTHYHTKNVSPAWSVGHSPAAVIGHHIFYNDVQ